MGTTDRGFDGDGASIFTPSEAARIAGLEARVAGLERMVRALSCATAVACAAAAIGYVSGRASSGDGGPLKAGVIEARRLDVIDGEGRRVASFGVSDDGTEVPSMTLGVSSAGNFAFANALGFAAFDSNQRRRVLVTGGDASRLEKRPGLYLTDDQEMPVGGLAGFEDGGANLYLASGGGRAQVDMRITSAADRRGRFVARPRMTFVDDNGVIRLRMGIGAEDGGSGRSDRPMIDFAAGEDAGADETRLLP